jgi:hypothetical protein
VLGITSRAGAEREASADGLVPSGSRCAPGFTREVVQCAASGAATACARAGDVLFARRTVNADPSEPVGRTAPSRYEAVRLAAIAGVIRSDPIRAVCVPSLSKSLRYKGIGR